MADVEISYNNETIASLSSSGTEILDTAETFMADDITISYTKPSAPSPSLQAKTNIAPTTSSQTITPDSGYDGLSSVQINAMPTGTAGTPTATKGTVSNHAVSVTPKVTNTTGYITGSTKTGTAVSVSASELVSGTKSITENGTGIDVANYASVDVNVSGGGSAVIQSLSATANGTYTPPSGVDGYSPVVVYVSGSNSSYELLHSETITATNITTTSGVTLATLSDNAYVTQAALIYVRIRDNAGKRNGYFYGTDTVFFPVLSETNNNNAGRKLYRIDSSGAIQTYTGSSGTTGGLGVYAENITNIASKHDIIIRGKYSSTNSGTIDGSYLVEVYLLKYPDNISPFN